MELLKLKIYIIMEQKLILKNKKQAFWTVFYSVMCPCSYLLLGSKARKKPKKVLKKPFKNFNKIEIFKFIKY